MARLRLYKEDIMILEITSTVSAELQDIVYELAVDRDLDVDDVWESVPDLVIDYGTTLNQNNTDDWAQEVVQYMIEHDIAELEIRTS